MRVYLAIKYHPDGANRPRIEGLSMALTACGFEVFCLARDVEQWGAAPFPDSAALMRRTFEEIDRCDMLLVDLTEKGVGVGIEAGVAAARGIPVIVVAGRGSPVSETLAGIAAQVWHYADIGELAPHFRALGRPPRGQPG